MRKIIGSVLFLGLVLGFGFTTDFSKILAWLHTNNLTKYETVETFRGSDSITRGEAAKFVNQYAQFMQLDKNYTECNFSDITDYDYTLVPHIAEACAYGLLKGSQGMFMPTDNITQAQGITVVMRSLYGIQDETTVTPWWKNYYTLARQAGILTSEDLHDMGDTLLTRELLGRWFYAAAHLGANINIDDEVAMDVMTETDGEVEKKEIPGLIGYLSYNAVKVEEALAAGKDVYLFFHAERCPSCRTLDKNLLAVSSFPQDTVIFKINYDTATDLVNTYNIIKQHTIIKIDTNKEETHRNTTATDLDEVMKIDSEKHI